METPARHSFTLDGATRVFPIPSDLKGDNYVRLEVDGVIVVDRAKYDLVNNAVVFSNVADLPSGSQLDVLVVQSEEAIGALAITTNIDIVATNISNINLVGLDIASINTASANIVDIQNAAANAASATASETATAADRIATAADKVSTNADRVAIETLYDNFDDRYLGTKAADPALDNDGAALLIGATYYNSTYSTTRFYNGVDWESPQETATTGAATASAQATIATEKAAIVVGIFDSVISVVKVNTAYVASAGQTTFTQAYDVGAVDVYVEGLKLVPVLDFAATDGTTLVLTSALTVGKNVEIISHGVVSSSASQVEW
jgi:hypothetical protein